MKAYTVTRMTLLSQTFTVTANNRGEARQLVADLPTSRDTEETPDGVDAGPSHVERVSYHVAKSDFFPKEGSDGDEAS